MKKNKIYFLLIIILVLAPSFVYAAWWNPLSWFAKKIDQEDENLGEIIQIQEPVLPVVTDEPVIEIVKEKPITQVITKTITVQDPALQKEIDTLISENSILKAQNILLINTNSTLSSSLVSCENKPIEIAKPDNSARIVALNSIVNMITDWIHVGDIGNNQISQPLITTICTSEKSKLDNYVFQYNSLTTESNMHLPKFDGTATCDIADLQSYQADVHILLDNL